MTHATRRRIELLNVAMLAWMIERGYVRDDCGILDINSHARYNFSSIVFAAMQATSPTSQRQRL